MSEVPWRRRLLEALRWAAVAACVALFIRTLATADLAAAWSRIRAIGPVVLFVLVPFAVGLAFDAAAWGRLFAALGRRVRMATLFRVRLATEAVLNTAPVGAVFAEAIAPVLVAQRSDASIPDAVAASTAKRWLVVRMHAVYVVVALALGIDAVVRASTALTGKPNVLPVIVAAGALGLILFSSGLELVATRGGVAGRASGLLRRSSRLEAWIEERHHHFERADTQLTRLGDDKRAGLSASLRLAVLWLAEGFETFLILRLLGAPLGFVEVISFDAALSIVRSAAVFAPAGIGVQDVGYLAVLSAYGVPDAAAIGPAFVVLKRLKEAVWIAVGLVILARSGARKVAREAQAT